MTGLILDVLIRRPGHISCCISILLVVGSTPSSSLVIRQSGQSPSCSTPCVPLAFYPSTVPTVTVLLCVPKYSRQACLFSTLILPSFGRNTFRKRYSVLEIFFVLSTLSLIVIPLSPFGSFMSIIHILLFIEFARTQISRPCNKIGLKTQCRHRLDNYFLYKRSA